MSVLDRAWIVLLTAATLTSGGCSGDGPAGPSVAVTDSAGLHIVTYDLSDAAAPTFRSVGPHDLEIGERAGAAEYAFSRIADLAVADDGTIIVSDGVAREIRTYRPDGAYLRTLAGPGDGPGELAAPPTFAAIAGDTVFAFDVPEHSAWTGWCSRPTASCAGRSTHRPMSTSGSSPRSTWWASFWTTWTCPT
jgi:hypothetical protein